MTDLDIVDDLADPVLVAAFAGWNDAADAASGTVDRLIEQWDAELVHEFEPDDYYDFQVNRPHVALTDEGARSITWPTTRVYVARPERAARDLVLLRGVEPNMRWRPFCAEILTVAEKLDVRMAVAVGALLADVPHTRPIPVSGTVSDPELGARLGLEPSTYEGPTGITGVFHDLCAEADLPSLSLWAAVPHYVAQPPCPKATLALLGRLEDLLELPIDLGDLVEEARAWERGVDELAREDTEVADYVRSLEDARDASELPEASGDAIARDFERYLERRQRDTD
ncbi:MAG: PAC2 family protein [Actinomycetota bacterium]|nr:PAC2 family protein [Actinomycetota bacterium]MDQ3664038.1 PAC2 family protein [Actinomycetota bacterium]